MRLAFWFSPIPTTIFFQMADYFQFSSCFSDEFLFCSTRLIIKYSFSYRCRPLRVASCGTSSITLRNNSPFESHALVRRNVLQIRYAFDETSIPLRQTIVCRPLPWTATGINSFVCEEQLDTSRSSRENPSPRRFFRAARGSCSK